MSFAWSTIGFAHPVPPVHYHEYALSGLLTEVSGHILFGLAAVLVTRDIGLAMLAGGESILIDVDHLLPALGYPVEGRLAHSVFFALVAAGVLAYVSRRGGRPNRGVFAVTLSAFGAHLSYDVFAGNGVFFLAAPLSFSSFNLPLWTWLPLEVAAFITAAFSVLPRLRPFPQ
jgi:hypothetical protein